MNIQTFAGLRNWSLTLFALASADMSAQVTAFRMNDLDLRDPHVFVNLIGCRDVTDTPLVGFSVNGELQTSIQTDGDTPADGLLDLSNVFLFQPLDQSLTTNPFDSGDAACTAPLASTACSLFASSGLTGDAVLSSSAPCLEPIAAALHGYIPGVISANAPCFGSPVGTISLDLGGIAVPLQDAQIAATFVGNPAGSTVNGLMKGFLRESDADAVIIPATFPLIGGLPLSEILPGGDPPGPGVNCAVHSDIDLHNDVRGWWFYLNFTAPSVPLDFDPFASGFTHGFED